MKHTTLSSGMLFLILSTNVLFAASVEDADYDGIPDLLDRHPYVCDNLLVTWDIFNISVASDITVTKVSSNNDTIQNVIDYSVYDEKSAQDNNTSSHETTKSAGVETSVKTSASIKPAFATASAEVSLTTHAGMSCSSQKAYEIRNISTIKQKEERRKKGMKLINNLCEKRLENPHWSISVRFYNHTTNEVTIKNCEVPILYNDTEIAIAIPEDGRKSITLPARRPMGVNILFKAPMKTTQACKIAELGEPQFDILRSEVKIQYEGEESDLISDWHTKLKNTAHLTVRNITHETTFYIALYDKKKLTNCTLRTVLEQINNILCDRENDPPFCYIKGDEIVSMDGKPNNDRGWWTIIDRGEPINHTDYLDSLIKGNLLLEYRTNMPRVNIERIAEYSKSERGFSYALKDLYVVNRNYIDAWKACQSVCSQNIQTASATALRFANMIAKDERLEQLVKKATNSSNTNIAAMAIRCLAKAYTGNLKLTEVWNRKAAELGDADAMLCLANLYKSRKGGEETDKEAVLWYRKAVEFGNSKAFVNLGNMYSEGRGVDKDDGEAFVQYRKAAELDDGEAMAKLGLMYKKGGWVKKDERKAAMWFNKAAELGNVEGLILLARIYESGIGVKTNKEEVLNWYRKAADLDNTDAMVSIGDIYIVTNVKTAATWYRKAADLDNTDAMVRLGLMYLKGIGVKTNIEEAVRLLQKAAGFGKNSAVFLLGYIYEKGEGIGQDEEVAANWYRKAAVLDTTNVFAPGTPLITSIIEFNYANAPLRSKRAVLEIKNTTKRATPSIIINFENNNSRTSSVHNIGSIKALGDTDFGDWWGKPAIIPNDIVKVMIDGYIPQKLYFYNTRKGEITMSQGFSMKKAAEILEIITNGKENITIADLRKK